MFKRWGLPFVGRIFWKVFPVVVVSIVVSWIVSVKYFGYAMKSQDYPGSVISGVILIYLIHLWLLPPEAPPTETPPEVDDSDLE